MEVTIPAIRPETLRRMGWRPPRSSAEAVARARAALSRVDLVLRELRARQGRPRPPTVGELLARLALLEAEERDAFRAGRQPSPECEYGIDVLREVLAAIADDRA